MKAIILAAGLGTRLGDLTKASPKCLVKINGRSLLEWQLRALKKAGCSDIVLVIGTKGNCWTQHSHKIIKKLHDKILFNFRNTTSQNTFSLHLALNKMEPEDFLSIDGDVLFSEKVIFDLIQAKHDIAIVSKPAADPLAAGTKVVCDKNNYVLKMGKKIVPDVFPWNIHSGLFKVRHHAFSFFQNLVSASSLQQDTGIVLNKACSEKIVYNFNSDGWVNINTPCDKEKAMHMMTIGKKWH